MSIERIDNDEANQVIIDKLKAIAESESAKPISEQDVDLIDECVDYLMELENGTELTDEDLEKGKQQIFELLDKKNKPKKKISIKRLLIAACIAVVFLLADFAAVAYDSDFHTVSILKKFGKNIIEMVVGEKRELGGVTIIKESESLSFDSVNDFRESTDYDILYPTVFPNGAELEKIYITGSYDANNEYISNYHSIYFATSVPSLGVVVHTNPDYRKDFMTDPDLIREEIGGHLCYFFEEGTMLQCSFVYNDMTYVVTTRNYAELKTIIENLREI